ncbi:hypothetical protein M4D81_16270 [Paenibacillus sp. p3-SID867]|uniref:hypothetical protein n=1 Tax=Paenibacillus sp. p3-SID867 TaxID=2916363 RepID=UPI0021A788BA|nr:hypothetical protein [Paenibacillus sp. p3-SID867]MCT1400586.1 hypothetical protein [Paenibacillus sp. p3-SID867]
MGTWYFEVDNDGTAYRQMVHNEDGSWITSNRKHESRHFLLAEHPLDPKEPYYEEISQAAFEELWQKQLLACMEDWQRIQRLFPIGARVEGWIEVFFPQGTLINLLEPRAVGLTDTSALEAGTPAEWMYPRFRVLAEVSGYDELNQWVLLANAELLGSQLDESESGK